MAAETKTSVVKVKPSSQDAKGKEDWSVTRKKIESSLKRPVDFKNKSPPPLIKSEVKTKTISSSSKTTTTKTTTKTTVRAKKVYTLAGQKYDPPEEREPLRIFYESLSKQIPSSEMAEFWYVFMADGRRERTHASRFCLSGVREYMKGHLRLRKNSRKSITERSSDLVLLAGREEASAGELPDQRVFLLRLGLPLR